MMCKAGCRLGQEQAWLQSSESPQTIFSTATGVAAQGFAKEKEQGPRELVLRNTTRNGSPDGQGSGHAPPITPTSEIFFSLVGGQSQGSEGSHTGLPGQLDHYQSCLILCAGSQRALEGGEGQARGIGAPAA